MPPVRPGCVGSVMGRSGNKPMHLLLPDTGHAWCLPLEVVYMSMDADQVTCPLCLGYLATRVEVSLSGPVTCGVCFGVSYNGPVCALCRPEVPYS